MSKHDQVQVEKVAGRWQVSVAGIVVGHVARTPEVAWSAAPWTIVGDRALVLGGGRNSRRRKRRGWGSKEVAARELAVMNSGLVIKALCASTPPDPMFVMRYLNESRPSAASPAERVSFG